jgi:hypothetical protein
VFMLSGTLQNLLFIFEVLPNVLGECYKRQSYAEYLSVYGRPSECEVIVRPSITSTNP